MKMEPATPLPYVLGHPTNTYPVSPEEIASGPHTIVSIGMPGYTTYEFAKAHTRKDAEFFVHASNAYPKLTSFPSRQEIQDTLFLFREELEKNMHNSSGSPGHDAMMVALHTFFQKRLESLK